MRSLILTTTLLVALLWLISLPLSTVALPKKLAAGHYHQKGSSRLQDSKVGVFPPSSSPLLLPGLPNVPELPNVLELSNIPKIPNLPGLPNIPEIPNIPEFPNIPEIPNIPRIPEIPNIPGLPIISEIPNIPRIPDIPKLPNIPGISGLPGLSWIPNIPTLPNIPSLSGLPWIPNIPRLPNIPGLPRLILGMSPLSPLESVVFLQSVKMEECLTKDGSKTAEKCFSQIFSSWVEKDFALDKECCEIVEKMDKKCNSHVRMLFKSRFFSPLLQYSCHIKHTKN